MEITKTIRLDNDVYIPICAVANPTIISDWYEGVNIDAIVWNSSGYEQFKGLLVTARSGGNSSIYAKSFSDTNVRFGFKLLENSISGLRKIIIYAKGEGHMVTTIHATDGVIMPILDELTTTNVQEFKLNTVR